RPPKLGFMIGEEDNRCEMVTLTITSHSAVATSSISLSILYAKAECMKKLQDEIRSNTTPLISSYIKEEEEVEKMRYLKAVIKRYHDNSIMVYDIAAGTEMITSAWAIQRDSALWGQEAEEFKPKRHLDSPLDCRAKDLNYIPFGSGRRICPGTSFALGLAQVAVANLVGRFDWRVEVRPPPGDHQSDIAELSCWY
ncbi:hypothetical protein EUTSA_v10017655mg, partial [Eutrema salsugineum]